MLISDLIRYREDLQTKIENLSIGKSINQDCLMLENLLGHHPPNTTFAKLQQTKDKIQNITNQFNNIKVELQDILEEINNTIDTESFKIFNHSTIEFYSTINTHNFVLDNSVNGIVQAQIHKHASHFYPALQFGCVPKSKSLTSDLVANDPLYLCDFSQSNIENVSNQFNEIYNRRLRKYILNDYELHQLPHNQFGFIFSWMVFNYANFVTVSHYLERMIRLLRPGGHFLFSYNNCDLLDSCLVAEAGSMSYVTKRNLIEICKKFGYEIIDLVDVPNSDYHVKYVSWIELRKPGELSTVKRRQVMGAIHQK